MDGSAGNQLRWRRRAAIGLLGLGGLAAGLAAKGAVDSTRVGLDPGFLGIADTTYSSLECLRGKMAALPDVPTFAEGAADGPDAFAYQRTIELGFGLVDFVDERSAAEQVIAIVRVPIGPGTCRDYGISVTSP